MSDNNLSQNNQLLSPLNSANEIVNNNYDSAPTIQPTDKPDNNIFQENKVYQSNHYNEEKTQDKSKQKMYQPVIKVKNLSWFKIYLYCSFILLVIIIDIVLQIITKSISICLIINDANDLIFILIQFIRRAKNAYLIKRKSKEIGLVECSPFDFYFILSFVGGFILRIIEVVFFCTEYKSGKYCPLAVYILINIALFILRSISLCALYPKKEYL